MDDGFFFQNPPAFSDSDEGATLGATPPALGGESPVAQSPVVVEDSLSLTGEVTALGSPLEFDTTLGQYNAAFLIDSTHVMCFWRGVGGDGFCRIFEVDTSDGSMTALGSALEFDTDSALHLSAFLIDATHVMAFWSGTSADGFCQIFEIDASDGTITALDSALEFDTDAASHISAFLIDTTHVMAFWSGTNDDGFCRIFEIDASDGSMTALGSALEFDPARSTFNSAFLIDATHVMCFWAGTATDDGYCQIFEIDTSDGSMTALGSALEFDIVSGTYTSAFLIDATHAMCFWSGQGSDGFCQIFEIDTSDGSMTALGSALEFDTTNDLYNGATLITTSYVMNFWSGDGSDGFCRVFEIDASDGSITAMNSALEFDTSLLSYPSPVLIDNTHVMCFWAGVSNDGFCQIFELTES